MKNKTYIIAVMVFCLGVLMLLGSSYSLIVGNLVSEESYGFDVANFDIQFSDNKKISISGIPESDEDGLKNSKEFTFTIKNNNNYDINYRLDIIENNDTKMSDVIHYVYAINNENYSKVISLKDNYTIKQNKVLKPNQSDTYKVKMWLSIDADEAYMNKTFSANILLTATQNEYKYATTVIEKLANNKQDNIILTNRDYRYSKSSSNYLWFNCQDGFTKGDDYCEKWQIIGSFYNRTSDTSEEYQMLKIINTNVIEQVAFNNNELTGEYDKSYIETFANGSYYDKLYSEAKKQIIKARWNIGNSSSLSYEESLQEEKLKYYYGYIGLPNLSDYLYIRNDSFINDNNVLFINKNNSGVYVLNKELIQGKSNDSYNFLPCIYLRPDVSILSGTGQEDNPYEIGIKFPMNY